MGVEVDFTQWGTIYLAPGQEATWGFNWGFDGNHWSRMSALPLPDSPSGSVVQILEERSTLGTLWVRWGNNGSAGVLFKPTVIVAPNRY